MPSLGWTTCPVSRRMSVQFGAENASWMQRLTVEDVLFYLPSELAQRVVETTQDRTPQLSYEGSCVGRMDVIVSYVYGKRLKDWLAIGDEVLVPTGFCSPEGAITGIFLSCTAQYVGHRKRSVRMSNYEILGEEVNLAAISDLERNRLLKPLVGKPNQVACMCQSSAIPMHVSRRDTNYFPVKPKGTGPKHAKLCRHNPLTTVEAATLSYDLSAIRSSTEDELVFTLSKPLRVGDTQSAVTTSIFTFSNGASRPVQNRMTELGLLHLLWERAHLNDYDPVMPVTAMWEQVRQAAIGIRPAGLNKLKFGFSELLMLPLRAENPSQRQWNFAKLNEARAKKRCVMFTATLSMSETAALMNAATVNFTLQQKFGVNVVLNTATAPQLLQNVQTSFSDELTYVKNPNVELVILGIAEPDRSINQANITSLVLMPVTKCHIPFDSWHEAVFTNELAVQKRKFRKPLRYDAVRYMQVHPDFVLLDTSGSHTVIEIYGMNTPEYLARKAEKRAIYASTEYPYPVWEWEAVTTPTLQQWLVSNPLPR